MTLSMSAPLYALNLHTGHSRKDIVIKTDATTLELLLRVHYIIDVLIQLKVITLSPRN